MKTGSDRTQRTASRAVQLQPAALSQTRKSGDQPSPLDASPRLVAQRQRLDSAFGPAIQRQPEEEELMQGKDLALQRQPKEEEEELMQGKGLPLQRQPEEEEEPLQGKFAAVQRQGPEEELQMKGKGLSFQRQPAEEEEEEPLQGKFATLQRQGREEEEELQMKAAPGPLQRQSEQSAGSAGGLPGGLKAGIESLSGYDMSGVRVHANSSKPAEIGALAYAQGNDIHLRPGQEKHLPHEAWHLVQQRQGRVKPTMQAKGVAINDDPVLEREADVMGQKALQRVQSRTVSGPHVRAGEKNDGAFASSTSVGKEVFEERVAQPMIMFDSVEIHPKLLYEATVEATKGKEDELLLAEEIVVSWEKSNIIHNFRKDDKKGRSAQDQLVRALKRAIKRRKEPQGEAPPLYKLSNLKFVTKESEREATLYFSAGGETGRIRQQHATGPYAAIDTPPKVRIFFKDRKAQTKFYHKLTDKSVVYKSGAKRLEAAKRAAGWFNWSNKPKNGYLLVEYYLAGKVAGGVHPSGGEVNTDKSGYSDQEISRIYRRAVGLS